MADSLPNAKLFSLGSSSSRRASIPAKLKKLEIYIEKIFSNKNQCPKLYKIKNLNVKDDTENKIDYELLAFILFHQSSIYFLWTPIIYYFSSFFIRIIVNPISCRFDYLNNIITWRCKHHLGDHFKNSLKIFNQNYKISPFCFSVNLLWKYQNDYAYKQTSIMTSIFLFL